MAGSRGAGGAAMLFSGFLAGFAAVLLFHQSVVAILYYAGLSPNAPYALGPVPPFRVPRLYSLAFWGGVWGVPLVWLLERLPSRVPGWLFGLVFGALGPTLVSWFVVAPLKGQPMASGWNPAGMWRGLAVNGAWGLGTVWLLPTMIRLPLLARAAGRGDGG